MYNGRVLLLLYYTAIGTQRTNARARATVLCNGHYTVGVPFYTIVLAERTKERCLLLDWYRQINVYQFNDDRDSVFTTFPNKYT